MIKISDIASKHDLRINKVLKKGNVLLIDSNKGKYAVKKNEKNDVIDYLIARNFDYYPEIVDIDDNYMITRYVEEINSPLEYKIMDMVKLISLLHSKTTYFKEANLDDYKEIYEDINNNIEYLYSYYNDIVTQAETHIYMSPSEYLLARNMNLILKSLSWCKTNIDSWYELVKEKTKMRVAVLHNNLKLDHFIISDKPYLISWNKSKIGMPIFDLFKLYKRHANEYEFDEILKKYEMDYPLLEDEKKLFFVLICLPDKIELDENEIINCYNINNSLELLYKSNNFVNNYNK